MTFRFAHAAVTLAKTPRSRITMHSALLDSTLHVVLNRLLHDTVGLSVSLRANSAYLLESIIVCDFQVVAVVALFSELPELTGVLFEGVMPAVQASLEAVRADLRAPSVRDLLFRN